jgi:hypothetical protein
LFHPPASTSPPANHFEANLRHPIPLVNTSVCISKDKDFEKNETTNRQMGLHQTKKILYSKGNNQQSREIGDWEKIFTKHTSDRELISKICEDLKQSTARK